MYVNFEIIIKLERKNDHHNHEHEHEGNGHEGIF